MTTNWADEEWAPPSAPNEKKKKPYRRPPVEHWTDAFTHQFASVHWENELTQLGLENLLQTTKDNPGGTFIILDINESRPINRFIHRLLFGTLPDHFFLLVCKKKFVNPICERCKQPSRQKIVATTQRILLRKSKKQPVGVSMVEFYCFGLSSIFHRLAYPDDQKPASRPQPSIIVFTENVQLRSKMQDAKHPHYLTFLDPRELNQKTRLPGNVPLQVGGFLKSLLETKDKKSSNARCRSSQTDVGPIVLSKATEACAMWLLSQAGSEEKLPKSVEKLSNVLSRHFKVKLQPEVGDVFSRLLSEEIVSTCNVCENLCYDPTKVTQFNSRVGDDKLDPTEAVYRQVSTWIRTQPRDILPRSFDALRSHISSSSVNYVCNSSDVISELFKAGLIELIDAPTKEPKQQKSGWGYSHYNDTSEKILTYHLHTSEQPEQNSQQLVPTHKGQKPTFNYTIHNPEKIESWMQVLPVPKEIPTWFDHFGLADDIIRGVYCYGFESPSFVQHVAISALMENPQRDMLIYGASGSGKTTAYAIPLLNYAAVHGTGSCTTLVVAPSRELASQIHRVFQAIAEFAKLKIVALLGGVSVLKNMKEAQSADILIGTPGRISDVMKRGNSYVFSDIKFLVVDTVSFCNKDQLYDIISALDPNLNCILVDTVFTEDNMEYFPKFLRNPVVVPHSPYSKTEIGALRFMQNVVHKKVDVASWSGAVEKLESLLDCSTMIFCNTKNEVERLADEMRMRDWTISSVHGDMDMAMRTLILQEFRAGSSRFLITTPSFGMGLDIHQVEVVINFSMPSSALHYLQQAGRTGRYGRKGAVLTFIDSSKRSPENDKVMREVEKYVGPLLKH